MVTKVLYNNSTGKYVMWMIIDNDARDLAMAGIAVELLYSTLGRSTW